MVDRKDALAVTRKCVLRDLPRSTFYHVAKPVSEEELKLMMLTAAIWDSVYYETVVRLAT